MAKCKNCGNWLPDNALMCNVCGTPQNAGPSQSPQQQYQQPVYNPQPQAEPVHNTWSLPKSGQAPQPASQVPPPPPPAPEEPPKSGKGKKIALFSILGVVLVGLIILAVVLFTGGKDGGKDADSSGDSEETSQYVGIYEVVSCSMDGNDMEVSEEYVELKKNGRAAIFVDDETFSGTWELDGEDLTITQDGDVFEGTLEDWTLTLDMDGMIYVFVHEAHMNDEDGTGEPTAPDSPSPDAAPEEKPQDAPQEEPQSYPTITSPTAPSDNSGSYPQHDISDGIQWWAGEWYGWWIVRDARGSVADLVDYPFDVCARITINEDGTGHVSMWDQDETTTQSRWEVSIVIQEGADARGKMVSRGGSFWNSNLIWDDWKVDPTEVPYSYYDDMICIRGTWSSLDDYATSCEYYVFLRPWGTQWEDIRNGNMSDMPYTDMMPVLYDSWYLPLIQAGEEMPSRFPRD